MRLLYTTWGYEGPSWVAYWYFNGWNHIQLGFHLDTTAPNIEIHLPFGFFRIGRRRGLIRPRESNWVFGYRFGS